MILKAYGTEICFHGQALLKDTNFYILPHIILPNSFYIFLV